MRNTDNYKELTLEQLQEAIKDFFTHKKVETPTYSLIAYGEENYRLFNEAMKKAGEKIIKDAEGNNKLWNQLKGDYKMVYPENIDLDFSKETCDWSFPALSVKNPNPEGLEKVGLDGQHFKVALTRGFKAGSLITADIRELPLLLVIEDPVSDGGVDQTWFHTVVIYGGKPGSFYPVKYLLPGTEYFEIKP